ncbi:PREDICTED: probable leucine-rich repeat receptor-like protein kinase At1g68400 [Tarenaya hassleriana]|uniref:probable leucine-rich repeat receptor-like protein kinase At1g68400 n=1 Tax=Tarenaya hassleriana TaxID=28532 RepID=UPI00053C5843|nr:PREDICTED: probable leucine-rich repeat receptor-like protein kinase At1g68400 [Tarenaya hassleriana]
MAKSSRFNQHFAFSLLFLSLLRCSSSSSADLKPLLDFKSTADSAGKLWSWNSTAELCKWTGVSCVGNRVTRLVLENLGLSGSFEPLASLTELRVLSLKGNRLSGPVPDLSKLKTLKLLFLSLNEFSGEFPVSVTSLSRLNRLDISFNNFSGEIPLTINHLTHLLTLRLEGNQFSGPIPGLGLSDLQDFNVSSNHLTGQIPESLSGFPHSAFAQNPSLCGAPLLKCLGISGDPTKPGSGGARASPLMNSQTIPSSPTSVHSKKETKKPSESDKDSTTRISTLALVAIIIGDAIILSLVSLLLYCCFWRQYAANRKDSKVLEGEKILYSSSPYTARGQNNNNQQQQGGFERGRMVFFEGTRRFELEDLLRASAEMLGKGGFGTAYKAVLEDGSVVAVKRLKDGGVAAGKREFEQQMEILGRLRHQNLVSLKAYYFASEEKLLVYEYMPHGSLFWLLHGNRGPGRTPLDWVTRLKIASAAARGLAFIHGSSKSMKLTHGNIKSTNVLLDKSGNARLADVAPPQPPATTAKSTGYRAPELADGRKPTQKSDVYSFGVLLLELLTGKCPNLVDLGHVTGPGSGGAVDLPRWVQSVVREEWTAEVFDLELMRYKDIEEEMVGLLQIAMACTAAAADQRPRMCHVVKMIDEIRGSAEASPSQDGVDSVADSPCLSDDTSGATSQ